MQFLGKPVVFVISATESKDDKKQQIQKKIEISKTIYPNHSVEGIKTIRPRKPLQT